MQRVTVPPLKLIAGAEPQVALGAPAGPLNVLGSTVAKDPSNRPPVAPNSPTATAVIVPPPMSMHFPLFV
jgi:hypothetical protein